MKPNMHRYWGPERLVAAVRREEDLEAGLACPWPVLFLLIGDLFNAETYVAQAQAAGKKVFLHVDFLAGLGGDPVALRFVAERIKPEGIISTKSHVVKNAKKHGLLAIQRVFLIDTSALEQGIHNIRQSGPDAVEIMPGLIPRVITELAGSISLPIIAGGLIKERSEVEAALQAGASAVSMGNRSLWS